MRLMHWDCDRDGCFEKKKRVKLGYFDDCFPGCIGMTDIDGFVEIRSNFFLLEWKGPGVHVPRGQEIAYSRLTASRVFTLLVVEGDAEHMTAERFQLWVGGRPKPWRRAGLEGTKKIISRWSEYATKE